MSKAANDEQGCQRLHHLNDIARPPFGNWAQRPVGPQRIAPSGSSYRSQVPTLNPEPSKSKTANDLQCCHQRFRPSSAPKPPFVVVIATAKFFKELPPALSAVCPITAGGLPFWPDPIVRLLAAIAVPKVNKISYAMKVIVPWPA